MIKCLVTLMAQDLTQTDTIALLEIIGTNNTNRMEVKGETIYWWVSISVRLVAFLGAYFRKGKGREGALYIKRQQHF